MRFLVAQVAPEGLDLLFEEDQDALTRLLDVAPDDPAGVHAAGALRLEGHVQAHEDDLLITGQIRCAVTLECRRCLSPVVLDLDLGFSATCIPASALQPTEDEVELSAEDLEVLTYDGDAVDLDAVVREQILLGVPAYPLCREDCAGLCAQCGSNLNDTPCGCEPEPLDPRWAKLKDMKLEPGSH